MLLSRNIFASLCMLGALFLWSCTETQRSPNEPVKTAARPIVSSPTPTSRVSADSTDYVFDISSLLGLTTDQIRARLGKPVSDEQESINEMIKSLFYQRQGYDLLIEYNVRSRQVIRFYINPNKSTKDNQHLLDAANITPGDSRFVIEYLNDEDGLYRGIVIVPDSVMTSIRP